MIGQQGQIMITVMWFIHIVEPLLSKLIDPEFSPRIALGDYSILLSCHTTTMNVNHVKAQSGPIVLTSPFSEQYSQFTGVWPESPQVNLLCTKYTYTHLGLRYISVHHTHPNIKHVLHRGCVVPNRQHFAHCICTQNYGRATYYYHHDMYVCTKAVEGLGTI